MLDVVVRSCTSNAQFVYEVLDRRRPIIAEKDVFTGQPWLLEQRRCCEQAVEIVERLVVISVGLGWTTTVRECRHTTSTKSMYFRFVGESGLTGFEPNEDIPGMRPRFTRPFRAVTSWIQIPCGPLRSSRPFVAEADPTGFEPNPDGPGVWLTSFAIPGCDW